MICLRIAAATTALLALAGVAVHSLTKSSSAGTDFYTMKREVMETEYCTANGKTCLAIFYDLESRLYTGEGVIASDRRRLKECFDWDFTIDSPNDGFAEGGSFEHDFMWDMSGNEDERQIKFLNGDAIYSYLIIAGDTGARA